MDQIKTKAIVLRSVAFGDYDKMLTLLGENTGKISVIAKGGKSHGIFYLRARFVFGCLRV